MRRKKIESWATFDGINRSQVAPTLINIYLCGSFWSKRSLESVNMLKYFTKLLVEKCFYMYSSIIFRLDKGV